MSSSIGKRSRNDTRYASLNLNGTHYEPLAPIAGAPRDDAHYASLNLNGHILEDDTHYEPVISIRNRPSNNTHYEPLAPTGSTSRGDAHYASLNLNGHILEDDTHYEPVISIRNRSRENFQCGSAILEGKWFATLKMQRGKRSLETKKLLSSKTRRNAYSLTKQLNIHKDYFIKKTGDTPSTLKRELLREMKAKEYRGILKGEFNVDTPRKGSQYEATASRKGLFGKIKITGFGKSSRVAQILLSKISGLNKRMKETLSVSKKDLYEEVKSGVR